MTLPDPPARLLLLGGTPLARGGVEVFSERAVTALRENGIGVRHLPTESAHLGLRSLPSFLAALARAAGAALRERQVWLQYGNLADLTYLALALLPGVHIVVTPHLGTSWRSQSNSMLRLLSRTALSRADALALISPTQEDELDLPAAPLRSLIPTFLPNALEKVVPAQAPSLSSAPLRLIHAGRLSAGKGTLLVLEIARWLAQHDIKFQLELVGSPDATAAAAIESALADPKLQGHIWVAGHVDEATLLGKLAVADILLHLSKVDSFPLIVLEAVACGAYPVCLPLPGARTMVDSYTGSVVKGHDPVSEAVDIIVGFDRAEHRAQIERAAAAVRSDFSGRNAALAIASVALPGHPHASR